jgi:8-oxo-dGTP pyrophosphatase MutT (NUDIX family)
VPADAAATVVVLRARQPQDTPCGSGSGSGSDFETLLLRRDSRLAFHGGDWVFPGGRVDDADRERARQHGLPGAELGAARHAGSREVEEEAGLRVDPDALIPLSHWTTPDGLPRKFATWFFLTRLPPPEGGGGTGQSTEQSVQIDDGEIREYRWQLPQAALDDQRRGEIVLPGPTFVTLTWLSAFTRLDAVLENFRRATPPFLLPRPILCAGGRVSLLPGDAGYATGDLEARGARHRTWFLESGWRYERRD